MSLDLEGLLPPLGGGHFLTALTNHDQGNFDCPIFPKAPRYPQLWMTDLPDDPHWTRMDNTYNMPLAVIEHTTASELVMCPTTRAAA